MRGLKRLLVPVVVTAAFVGLSLPAAADPVPGPVEDGGVAVESWSRPLRVPVPKGRIVVEAAVISNRGHIAVVYRNYSVEGEVPGYVIVRSPGGVWSAPHRLNPPHSDILAVDVAFDGAGNLTAFWSSAVGPEGCCDEPRISRFEIATKPARRAWSAHLRTGRIEDHRIARLGLSVAPSGRAAIFWWQSLRPDRDPGLKAQFTVRVRPAADAPWRRARALSPPVAVYDPRFSSRDVWGDVAINNDGSGVAVWSVCPLTNDRFTCKIWRSTLRSSGRGTPPVRIARHGLVGSGELESTPAGFTAITWVNARMRTVVDLRTADGIWSRQVIPGAHSRLAVGPGGKVVLLRSVANESGLPSGLWVTWRSNRSDWSTKQLALKSRRILVLEPAVDRTGRIFVPWTSGRGEPVRRWRDFMSTYSSAWDTTMLRDWATNADFAVADVSRTGRAVAIWSVTNAQFTSTTVTMRVLHPR